MKKQSILKIFVSFLIIILVLIIFNTIKHNKTENTPKSSETVNVVYLTDSKYVTYMRTSIRSIIANKNPETKIKIFVIENKLSDKDIQKIKQEERKNVNIQFISAPEDLINKLNGGTETNPFVTRIDNSKFFLTSLLKDTDKVIYLDGDTIILKDLSELYSADLKDNYIAAVDDWQTGWPDKSDKRYFNNGVMLMNLDKMRNDDIEAKLVNDKLHNKNNRFVTQDSFNNVMYGKVLYLPLIYDTFAPEFDDKENLLIKIVMTLKKHYKAKLYPYDKPEEFQKDVVIIHYCGYGNFKPWYKIDLKRKSNVIWYKYAPLDFWPYCLRGGCKLPE